MKTIGKIVVGFVIFLVVVIALVFTLTSGVTKIADAFFEHAKAGALDKAYALTSKTYQAQTSEAQMTAFLESLGLTDVVDSNWGSREISGGEAAIAGNVKTGNGGTLPLRVEFVKDDDGWKIYRIVQEAAGTDKSIEVAPGTGGIQLPPESEQIQLVRDTMTLFAASINAKDFSAFHLAIADLWRKQMTVADLNEAFAGFINLEIDLAPPVRTLAPAFDGPPTLSENGVMTISGQFPSTPAPIIFKLGYVREGTSWKVVSTNVQIPPAPETPEAPATPATPAPAPAPAPATPVPATPTP